MVLKFSSQNDLCVIPPEEIDRLTIYYYDVDEQPRINYKDTKGRRYSKTIKRGSKLVIYADNYKA